MLKPMQLWRLKRRIHAAWFIALMTGCFVTGVAIAPHLKTGMFTAPLWLVLAGMVLLLAFSHRRLYMMLLVILGGLILGFWRGGIVRDELVVYRQVIGHAVTVTGTVQDDPDVGKNGELLLRLVNVIGQDKNIPGAMWVSTNAPVEPWRSDKVTVTGTLTPGFGSFAASMYRAKIVSIMRPEPGDVALRMRDWFSGLVRRAVSEPQASLGLGYLLGQRRALPPELDQALVVAGLTHIVVASGYNLTILVRLARRLFIRVSKYLATVSASAMIVSFIAVTGASPSMTRAGLVAGLSLAAWYYGRRFHPIILLSVAAAMTVAINPVYAWNDLGWQLSFAAFGGVMILAPLLQIYFFGSKEPGTLRQIIGETVSATIVTLPILVLAFGQFSNVSLLANVLILPFVPIAMVLTFVAGMGSFVFPMAASAIGLPAQWLLSYMTSIAEYFAGLPWALTIIEIQPWMAWAAYGCIVGVCIYLWRATKYDLARHNLVE